METVFWLVMVFIILESSLVGYLIYIFKINPGYRHLLNDDVLIRDDTLNLNRSWNGFRYKSLILTKKYLIMRNSLFTSLKNVDVGLIKLCSVEKKRRNRFKIIVIFDNDDTQSKLIFKSNKSEEWISAFRNLGIEVEMLLERR